jgi:hypothetical protein
LPNTQPRKGEAVDLSRRNREEDQMVRGHGSQVKDDRTYEALRKDGASKEKAARTADASADPHRHPGKKGGKSPAYHQWTVKDLRGRAGEIGIAGRSRMNKNELIDALRHH